MISRPNAILDYTTLTLRLRWQRQNLAGVGGRFTGIRHATGWHFLARPPGAVVAGAPASWAGRETRHAVLSDTSTPPKNNYQSARSRVRARSSRAAIL